ncbi:hypothetical protein ACQZ4Y_18655 [Rhizobium sp. L80/93]|uniref:hypothetical protein n=1 Tax=unclassified Rhizobium TaxID=2613769 RepID=UPI001ADC51E6|nr:MULTISPECIES: hypothetical protein [unclassified Rhizobium]MBO9171537.1 hypothetical protein [Rhizobium sp. L245/93]MBO9187403.1 hypothetical protein [Rhizobium sp. E27B/91]
MSAYRKALRLITFPFRAAWILILLANLLVVSAVWVLLAAFVSYGLALTISYAFLPTEWTRGLWHWAAELYAQSGWFSAATTFCFVLLLLPILKFWPARDSQAKIARERKATRQNNDLIAARQQRLAKLRG